MKYNLVKSLTTTCPCFLGFIWKLKNRFSVLFTKIVSNKKCSFVQRCWLAGFLSLIKVGKQTRCQYDWLSLLWSSNSFYAANHREYLSSPYDLCTCRVEDSRSQIQIQIMMLLTPAILCHKDTAKGPTPCFGTKCLSFLHFAVSFWHMGTLP